MNPSRRFLALGASLLTIPLLCVCWRSLAEPKQGRIVRIVELEIDPAQLETYKAAPTEEIEASIRVEPGVLTLDAVALKDHPARIRLFET